MRTKNKTIGLTYYQTLNTRTTTLHIHPQESAPSGLRTESTLGSQKRLLNQGLKKCPTQKNVQIIYEQRAKRLRSNYRIAQDAQAKYYNAKHTPKTFRPGDKVLLSAKELEPPCSVLANLRQNT